MKDNQKLLTMVKIANGDYIGFVDSDDWIEPNMYSEMIQYFEQNNCTMVECAINLANDTTIKKIQTMDNEIITGREALKGHLDEFYNPEVLRKKGTKYSALIVQALNYIQNNWYELQNYRKDGRYTIENLPAERIIRPFTVSRKKSLHYSSEEGVEMAVIYLTVIGMAKMWGLQIKEYLDMYGASDE